MWSTLTAQILKESYELPVWILDRDHLLKPPGETK